MVEIGDLVDKRYLITDHLGQGGMSLVYKATDKHLDRSVALKFLRPHLTDTDQERFRIEIKTLARLNHPGIVSIYDLGLGNHIYFAMELVEGGLFTDLSPLELDSETIKNLIRAAITVSEALAYVHKLGIVHRDLTPNNILITKSGQPKVMDFGLVHLAERSRELTRTGLTLGTPQYMAPEQAKAEAVAAHTDIYAFGAVLYKALTGKVPFKADNDQAVLCQHVYGKPISAIEHNPYIPKELSELVDSMLAKEPKDRPSSGRLIAENLEAILWQLNHESGKQRLAGPSNQGVYPFGPVNPKKLQVVWQINLSEGPQWPAGLSAAEGFIFMGLRSEELIAIRPADGSIQSRFEATDEVNAAPLFINNKLLYISRDGDLNALAWPSGRMLWQDRANTVGISPFGENILVTTRDGRLEHRDINNKLIWSYETDTPASTAAIVHKLNACFVSQNGWVHCVDALTGKGRFKIELEQIAATPSAKSGILLLPERAGELHAFDIEKREVLWTYDLEAELWAAPIAWGKFVYAVSWNNILHCISLKTGDDIWEYNLKQEVTATPIIAAGILYLASEAGNIMAFDALTGQKLFEDSVSLAPIQANPLVIGNSLIVAALDGTVKAYRSFDS